MKKIFSLLILLIFFSSCFHKSVESGDADDIVKALIYHGDEGVYLITVETIFQATSKSSENGINTTTGYTELRISSYDMSTGKQSARIAIGDQIEENISLLGWNEGNIWFYSVSDGLHSRDPKTLEIKTAESTIFENNSTLGGSLAECEWYSIPQYFSYEYSTDKIILTDNQGFHYSLDPVSFKTEKLKNDYTMPTDYSSDYFNTSGSLNNNDMNLSGDLRKQVQVSYKELASENSYLDGNFILDKNYNSIFNKINQSYVEFKLIIDSLADAKDSLKAKFGSDYWEYPDKERGIYEDINKAESNIKWVFDKIERDYEGITERNTISSLYYLLSPDSNTFFIAYKSSTSKDALLDIACLDLKNKSVLTQKWTVELADVFYDYNNARETDAFKSVFSKGSPDFDFKMFDLYENKLLIIYMLHAFCIDVNTGKILWNFKF